MALSMGDDFPLHQTSEPIAYAGTDRNFYDRYFFNGYSSDGEIFFALAFGVYPHLDIADAHFSVLAGGVQHCLHASCEIGMERLALKVGPIAIEVMEPLRRLKVTIAPSHAIAGQFTFTGRAFPIEEPRFIRRIGPRAFMDYTRMTQNGHYEGWIEIDGKRRELPAGTLGTRDRSWGIRPVGARDPQPIPGASAVPSFFWQWIPLSLAGSSLFFHWNADAAGMAWNSRAVEIADGWDGKTEPPPLAARLETRLEPNSRWPGRSRLEIGRKGASETLELEPLARFQMKGLGYTHPRWGHGLHHGPLACEREDFAPAELASNDPSNLHVQMLCRVGGAREGMGVFEQLALGPYAPLALEGLADPA